MYSPALWDRVGLTFLLYHDLKYPSTCKSYYGQFFFWQAGHCLLLQEQKGVANLHEWRIIHGQVRKQA